MSTIPGELWHGGGGDGSDRSTEDAKRELLEWSARADGEIRAEVGKIVGDVRSGIKGLAPWVAGGAAAIGLIVRLAGGRRGGKERRRASIVGMMIRTAIEYWPMIMAAIGSAKRRT